MPIYAYKCSSCGVSKDILRKISDPPLTLCPACGNETLSKQVTAAGFQLKGSGWYVTDFRGGDASKTGSEAPSDKASTSADAGASTSVPAPATASAPSPAPTPAPAPASAATSGAST